MDKWVGIITWIFVIAVAVQMLVVYCAGVYHFLFE